MGTCGRTMWNAGHQRPQVTVPEARVSVFTKMVSSDADSSSEDDLERFRESVDQQFLKDDFFTEKPKEPSVSIVNTTAKLPSLRRNINEEDQALNFFRVTPEFQKHVAKHLLAKLEEELKEYEMFVHATNHSSEVFDRHNKTRNRGGIKLLHSSQHHLNVTKQAQLDIIDVSKHNAKVKRKINDFDENAIVEQCQLVAVHGTDILNRKDVQLWSKRTKKDVYCYKVGERGILEYQEKPFVPVTYK